MIFDPLRNRYRFHCPTAQGEDTWVSVSDFRLVRRLRGTAAPTVFRVRYSCACGDEHDALVTHESLDFEPLGTETSSVFVDLASGQRELTAGQLTEIAARRIGHGTWPWTFYCYPESERRPAFPSAVRMVAPVHEHAGHERLGVLVRCPHCTRLTLNFVTREHLDVPFYNDPTILYVDRTLRDERMSPEEWFRHELAMGPRAAA